MAAMLTATTTTTTTSISSTKIEKDKILELYKQQVPSNTDITAVRNESLFSFPAFMRPFLLSIITDKRDYVQLEMVLNQTLVLLPLVGLFCYYPSHTFGLGLLLFRMIVFAQRYMLTMHIGAHTKLFVPKYNFMNSFAEVVLAVTMGMPPAFYYIHHVMMHHCENNVFPYDISSTMPYQRDSILSLVHYIYMYFTHALLYVPYYAWRKGKLFLFGRAIACSLLYFGGAALAMYKGYFLQSLWLMVIPYLVLGIAIMHGNYTQHIFVCPKDPFNNYKLAFNFINHPDNQITYNDGYHIIHHMNSRLHWAEVPHWFENNIEKFAENDALVFHSICNNDVFYYVFTNNYKELYKYWVQLRPDCLRNVEQFEALCKERLVPIHEEKNKKKSS